MSTNASRNWVGQTWHPEFVCECADERCTETLELSLAEYESIRASPIRFPVKVGHDYPEFERVVALSDGYAVVEKIGAAAEVAKTLDPRSRVKGGSLGLTSRTSRVSPSSRT